MEQAFVSGLVAGVFSLVAVALDHYLAERRARARALRVAHEPLSQASSRHTGGVPRRRRASSSFGKHVTPQRVALLLFLCTVGGVVASFIKIESVMVSGSLISAVGAILAIRCRQTSERTGIWLGVSAPIIAVLCFLAIWFLDWSPAEARKPIPVIGVIYTVLTTPSFFVFIWRRQGR